VRWRSVTTPVPRAPSPWECFAVQKKAFQLAARRGCTALPKGGGGIWQSICESVCGENAADDAPRRTPPWRRMLARGSFPISERIGDPYQLRAAVRGWMQFAGVMLVRKKRNSPSWRYFKSKASSLPSPHSVQCTQSPMVPFATLRAQLVARFRSRPAHVRSFVPPGLSSFKGRFLG